MSDTYPIHILLRYSDKLHGAADVIDAHKCVITDRGSVWFGKLGRTVAHKHVRKVNQQCAEGVATYLYLVQRTRQGYTVHQGDVVRMTRTLPVEQEHLIPQYYSRSNIIEHISLWTELSEIRELESGHLNSVRAVSSVVRMPETLATSMAAHFIVRETE